MTSLKLDLIIFLTEMLCTRELVLLINCFDLLLICYSCFHGNQIIAILIMPLNFFNSFWKIKIETEMLRDQHARLCIELNSSYLNKVGQNIYLFLNKYLSAIHHFIIELK